MNPKPRFYLPLILLLLSLLGILPAQSTFVRTIGTTFDEGGQMFVEDPVSGIILAGYKGDSCLLINFDTLGNEQWSMVFKATDQPEERIISIRIDNDNNLIGAGWANSSPSAGKGFAFRIDPATQTVLWITQLSAPSSLYDIYELSGTADFIACGQAFQLPGGLGWDGIVLRLNRLTGAISTFQHYFNLGSAESFVTSLVQNNHIYLGGRQNAAGGGLGQMRPALLKLDYNGNIVSDRLYIRDVSQSARIYGSEIGSRGDTIYYTGSGSFSGTNLGSSSGYLSLLDEDGSPHWSRRYDLPGGANFYFRRLIVLPDGYLISGRVSLSGNTDLVMIRTDRKGNIIWARSAGTSGNDFQANGGGFLVSGNRIWLTGTSSGGTGGSSDIFLAKLNMEGKMDTVCPQIDTLPVTSSFITPLYGDTFVINRLNSSYSRTGVNPTVNIYRFQITYHCFQVILDEFPGKLYAEWEDGDRFRARIIWEVSGETNGDYVLERSLDGRNFAPLNLPAFGRPGRLTFLDPAPEQTDQLFYRMSVRGPDGNLSYSSIITLLRPGENGCHFYLSGTAAGRPVLHFEANEKQLIHLELLDLSGKRLLSFRESTENGSKTITLPAEGLAPGIYLLRITDPKSGYSETLKFPFFD